MLSLITNGGFAVSVYVSRQRAKWEVIAGQQH